MGPSYHLSSSATQRRTICSKLSEDGHCSSILEGIKLGDLKLFPSITEWIVIKISSKELCPVRIYTRI